MEIGAEVGTEVGTEVGVKLTASGLKYYLLIWIIVLVV